VPGAARSLGAAALGALGSIAVALVPWLVLRPSLTGLLALTGVVMLISLLNAAVEVRHLEERSRDWTGWRFLLSLAAGGAVLGLQALGWLPLWDPTWPPVP